jgi:hypothetical protein
MSNSGYSDPIDHAFAFVAKHHPDLTGFGPATTNRSANLAVTLARYGCDEPTVVAGVLHSLMDACPVDLRSGLEVKVNEKFGPAVFVSLRDATEPRYDPEGRRRGWRTSKQEFLVHLLDADPRALDVVTANEIHWCGSSLTIVRRLGPEYLPIERGVGLGDIEWWHGSLAELLATRSDWQRRDMLEQLRATSAAVARSIGESP